MHGTTMANTRSGSVIDVAKRPIRVLILDDEEPIRRVIKHALVKQGCDVETAANGRQGLQILLTKTFDVAVVDVRMQEMDGLAFVQEAKKIWPWQGVVIYSGFLDDRIIEIAEREGVKHILTKPVDMQVLFAAILDEVHRQDTRAQGMDHLLPMNLISYQLNMMRHITEDTLHSRNLLTALTKLGQSITEMLPCHIMGILAIEADETVLLMTSTIPQPVTSVDYVLEHIIERYQALSGKPLKKDVLRVERVGPVSSHTVVRGIHSIICVPVLMGEELRGILTLASCESNAFSEVQTALLYHAAGNLSTLLSALGEIRRLAIRDPLTGLYNRLQLDEEMEKFWNLAVRYKKPMSVLLLDIDQFKSINDKRGHHAGDAVIREFADFLKGAVRASDTVARYGGDEFIIILPQADAQEVATMAHRLISSLRNRQFLTDKEPMSLTTSIGIAVFDPNRNQLPTGELIDRADKALYQAKKEGKNRFCFWGAPATPALSFPAASAPSVPLSTGDQPAGKARILVLDDEEYILLVLRRMLESDGYDVVTTGTIQEAQHLLESQPGSFDLTLCDLSLPDGDGLDLLKWCREHEPLMVTLVISGQVTADNAIMSLRYGAFDFIQKPISSPAMTAQIQKALRYHALQKENARYRLHLEEMVRAKNTELTKALEEIKVAYEFSLETMVAMLDAREYETGRHSVRVRELTIVLARTMGIEGPQLDEIARGALLHDIGKIGIPDSILLKPAKLTEDEWEVMRKHPEIGHRFLTNNAFLQTAAALVLSHHERWDGQGYPHKLAGEQINLGARIFAVIDAYDAMRSSRVYKNSVSMEKAVAEIKDKSGTQFDPTVVEAFLRCVTEIETVGRWSSSFV